MKLIIKIADLLRSFFSDSKIITDKKNQAKDPVFQIMDSIKFDEYGNPDFTYK